MNYHDQKLLQTLTHDIRKHWTAVSTLFGLISSVYRDLPHWRSNQQPQSRNTTPDHQSTLHSSDAKLVMVTAWLINLNVSCKLHSYFLQKTLSPPGPRLPRRIGNTHTRNYYDLKGKDAVEELYYEFCSRWFDLQWGRSRYTLLMRPNKVETAVRFTSYLLLTFLRMESIHCNTDERRFWTALVWFGLVWFYGTSTIVGYRIPSLFYINKQFYFKRFSLA